MMTLEEMSAHLEIRQALARYSRGVDRWDVEMLRSAYHPDGTDDHSVFVGLGWDFADWIVERYSSAGGVCQHHITHSLIEVDGAIAHVESYYLAQQDEPDERGGKTLMITGGRYLDRFELRDGAWRIARRVCTIDWSRAHLAGEDWDGAKAFPTVGPKGVDPLYAMLAQPAL